MNKTLLFYINAINGGGAERVIIQLAHHFATVGYRSILVTSFIDNNFEYKVPNNVTRISIEKKEIKQSKFSRNFSRIKELRNLIKEYKPAAVISFMAEPNFRTIIATRGLKTKTIVSVRNDPNREYMGTLGRIVGKYLMPKANGCVFQTDDAKKWFPEELQRKSSVILNEVKEEFFDVERTEYKDVVVVGRLNRQKNHNLAIKAFTKIAFKYPDINMRIYGEGNLRDTLETTIRDLQMSERIILCGATDNVASVLKYARIFILSSDYEGMPNCLMEALAAGVPSISTDCPCGGPKMLIKNGYNGLLVPVGSEAELAKSIDDLLCNIEKAEQIGRNAKIEAKNYRPEIVFKRWREYIESIIEGK